MKRSALCLALFGWPISAADDPPVQAPVALYVKFESQPPAVAVVTLERELRAILAPVGFDFAWRSVDETTNEVWTELAVVTFKGHCSTDSLARKGQFSGGALGWTHVSDGRVLPFAEVDCSRIGDLVGGRLFAFTARVREKVFQRAVARVAAHELYHVFTGKTVHGSWGVAKAEFSTEELLSDSFRFEGENARALRRKGAQDLLQFVRRAPLPAPVAPDSASH